MRAGTIGVRQSGVGIFPVGQDSTRSGLGGPVRNRGLFPAGTVVSSSLIRADISCRVMDLQHRIHSAGILAFSLEEEMP